MKKIILIIFLIFQTEMIFSQGELTSDSKYLENLKYKITEIVRTSIKEDKINYIKQEERNGGYSLVIEIWQDRNGNICKVKFNHIGKGLYTKKELRKIRKKCLKGKRCC